MAPSTLQLPSRAAAHTLGAMGLYDRYVLPHVIDFSCGSAPVRERRSRVVPRAQGRVLEVGAGSGRNLEHYDRSKVEELIALDPSPELRGKAERRAQRAGLDVRWLGLEAEAIPLDDASVDTVVITFTLCTIDDVAAALAEMRRVLRPDGELLFAEHGRAPDASVARLQRRLNPGWRLVSGGCRLDRDIPGLLHAAGFATPDLEAAYMPGIPKFSGYTYAGSARLSGD